MESRRRRSAHRRAGLSLVELLVVVAVVAVVVALALPAMHAARARAGDVRDHAVARDRALAVLAYAGDARGHFPYLGSPGHPLEGLWLQGRWHPEVGYFEQRQYYYEVLARSGYAPGHRDRVRAGGFVESLLMLSQHAFADARYWDRGAVPPDLGLLRGVALHEVAHPADKGLILDARRWSPRLGRPPVLLTAWTDASVTQHSLAAGERLPLVDRPHGSAPWPILASVGGARARERPILDAP